MCNNCNCDEYDKCSIVGFLPYGFCCSKCIHYSEDHRCLKMKISLEKKIIAVSTKYENPLIYNE